MKIFTPLMFCTLFLLVTSCGQNVHELSTQDRKALHSITVQELKPVSKSIRPVLEIPKVENAEEGDLIVVPSGKIFRLEQGQWKHVFTLESMSADAHIYRFRGIPKGSFGHNGDFYQDLATGNVYVKTDNEWQIVGNLKSSVYSGNNETAQSYLVGTAPDSSFGNDGDYAYSPSLGTLYKKENGNWIIVYMKSVDNDLGDNEEEQLVEMDSITALDRSEQKDIISSVTFPYLTHKGNRYLDTNLSLEKNRYLKMNCKLKKIVNDAQVLFSYRLPDYLQGDNVEIIDIKIKIDVTKYNVDHKYTTEMMCVSSDRVKKCSGELFKGSWKKLKNKNFFKTIKSPVNKIFINDLLANKNLFKFSFNLQKEYSLRRLLDLSTGELKKVLSNEDQLIHFIFTDDITPNKIPELFITYKIK